MTDRTIEELKAAEAGSASSVKPEAAPDSTPDRLEIDRASATRRNPHFRSEATRSGMAQEEIDALSLDEILERIFAAEQNGTKKARHSIETPEQTALLNEALVGLGTIVVPDPKRRLTGAAREELVALAGAYARSWAMIVAIRATGRFVREACDSGAETDLRVLKNEAYERAWANVSLDKVPARSLTEALSLHQLGFAGAVEFTTASHTLALASGLTAEEKRSQFANAASTAMLRSICVSEQKEYGVGLSAGLRNRLRGLHKDGIKIVVEAFEAMWGSEDALVSAANSAIDIIARATRDESSVVTAIKEADDFALDYAGKQRAAWVDKFTASDSWEDPNQGYTWNLDTELVNMAGQSWTLRDSFTSTAVFGVTGSGKSMTVAHTLLAAMLEAGYGGVFFCAKPDERESLERVIRKSGRGDDLVIVSAKSEAEMLGNNMLDQLAKKYAARGEVVPVESILTTLLTVIETAGTNTSESRGSNQPFFDAMKMLVRGAANLINLAGEDLTIPNLGLVMQSRAEGKVTRKWEETSYQAYLFRRAEWRMRHHALYRRNLNVQMVWEETQRFWKEQMPAFDNPEAKTGNFMQSCVTEFTGISDVMMKNPLLQRLFCQGSDYSAADAHERGSLIILDIAIEDQEYGGMVGKIAAGILMADTMRTALSRSGNTNADDSMRPVVHYCDEAQHFVVKELSKYLSTVRSKRYAFVAITQGVTSFHDVFAASPGGKETVATILQNIATWVTCQTPDKATRDLFSEACGQYKQRLRGHGGLTRSEQILPSSLDWKGFSEMVGNRGRTIEESWSESLQNYLQPQHFDRLLKAPENNWRAQTIVRTGKLFPDAPFGIESEAGQVIGPQTFQFVDWGRPVLLEDRLKAAEAPPPPMIAPANGSAEPAAPVAPVRKRGFFSRLFSADEPVPSPVQTPAAGSGDKSLGGMFN